MDVDIKYDRWAGILLVNCIRVSEVVEVVQHCFHYPWIVLFQLDGAFL